MEFKLDIGSYVNFDVNYSIASLLGFKKLFNK